MQHILALGLAAVGLLAGASALLQQVVVANLKTALGSAYWAVLISYIGGTLTMIIFWSSFENLLSPRAG